ncbi:PREDICTED: putative nuclease HARBI1 [Cyphomyrmex costatus]|nr:PREDICTED: putative nuclease HARBI1 [Cyphomyrmex costatus]
MGDYGGMDKSTVSRIMVRVSEAIASLANIYIKLPQTQEDILRTQRNFFNIAAFPKVIGAIDCTHIRIQSPGDSAYPARPYLFTPLLNPQGPAQQLYNESHIRTRTRVEHTFGLWKRRFPILAYGSRLQINTVMTIIIATAVLHNIAQRQGEDIPPPVDEEFDILEIIAHNRVPVLPYHQNNAGNAGLLAH